MVFAIVNILSIEDKKRRWRYKLLAFNMLKLNPLISRNIAYNLAYIYKLI